MSLGSRSAQGKAAGKEGRWEVTFDAQPANITGQLLRVVAGDQVIEMNNILIGDIWVMNGQSNMAFASEGRLPGPVRGRHGAAAVAASYSDSIRAPSPSTC